MKFFGITVAWLIFWIMAPVVGLDLESHSRPGSEPATALAAAPASCAAGAIDSATIDQSSGAAGLLVNVNGHTSIPDTNDVAVWFDGARLATLSVDDNGDFSGVVSVPNDKPDGVYSFSLAINDCIQNRKILCVGDSVTEGAFASSPENAYISLLADGLRRQNGDDTWLMDVYGVSGYGSLILDDIFNQPFYQVSLSPPPYFPRTWWRYSVPDLVVIELGVNNIPGLDWSTRYDDSYRGYLDDDEALAWWKTDVAGAVDFFVNQRGIPADHILILGQWPFGSSSNYRGERYEGGDHEDIWDTWNLEMENQANSLGCVFVPMADVFGPGYIPDSEEPGGDPEEYVDHQHGNSNVHPNDAGMTLFASRIAEYLPAEFNGGERFQLPFTVDTLSPYELPLTLEIGTPYWASFADFASGLLSVDFIFRNPGINTALATEITGSLNTNGVICVSDLPLAAGDIAPGSQSQVTMQYAIPPGVNYFRTSLTARALDAAGREHRYP